MVYLLASSQQQKRSQCSAVVGDEVNIQTTERSLAIMNHSPPAKETKIFGYKDTLFRLQLYFFQFE